MVQRSHCCGRVSLDKREPTTPTSIFILIGRVRSCRGTEKAAISCRADFACSISLRQARTSGLEKLHGTICQWSTVRKGALDVLLNPAKHRIGIFKVPNTKLYLILLVNLCIRKNLQYSIGITFRPTKSRFSEIPKHPRFIQNRGEQPLSIDLEPQLFFNIPLLVGRILKPAGNLACANRRYIARTRSSRGSES